MENVAEEGSPRESMDKQTSTGEVGVQAVEDEQSKDQAENIERKDINWFYYRGGEVRDKKVTHIQVDGTFATFPKRAFYNCTQLVEVDLFDASKITTIEEKAFRGCSAMISMVVPPNVTVIGEGAFFGCSALKTIMLAASGLERIEKSAFEKCSSIRSLETDLPDSVSWIGEAAFRDCRALTEIRVPPLVKGVADHCFANCSSLAKVTIAGAEGGTLGVVGKSAFEKCSALKSIDLRGSAETAAVKYIGGSAFHGCTSLAHVELPSSVENIGGNAFGACSSLVSLASLATTQITVVSRATFYNCTSLRKMVLPPSVETVNYDVFKGCTSLVHVAFAKTSPVTGIWNSTFRGCQSLSSLLLPDSLTFFGTGAMHGCSSLTILQLPETVTSIGDGAFAGCSKLTSVALSPKKSTTADDKDKVAENAFDGCDALLALRKKSIDSRSMDQWLRHRYDEFPLHRACLSPTIKAQDIRELNEHAGDIDEAGMNPLHLLTANPSVSVDTINAIFASSPNGKTLLLTAQDCHWRTPLHYAVVNPNMTLDILQSMVGGIATFSFGVEDKGRKCATALAVDFEQPLEIQQWLYRYRPVEAKELRFPIAVADDMVQLLASNYVEEIVQESFIKGGSLSLAEQDGWVQFCCQIRDEHLIQRLVEFIQNCDRRTAKSLAHAHDFQGRKAINIAVKGIKFALQTALLFCGRYDLEERPKYQSRTCLVIFGTDVRGGDREDGGAVANMPVALKFLHEKEHFIAEVSSRLKDPDDVDSKRFHDDFVLAALETYNGDEDEEFAQAAAKSELPKYCLVLEQGERNLSEAIGAENLTASPLAVCSVLYELAMCLQHIHNKGYVHGDFKPKNIVRQTDDRRWNCIDFDGTVEIGQPMGLKVSTAYIPPEMVKVERKEPVLLAICNTDAPDRAIVAHPSFDVWSFGVVMYQLVTEKLYLMEGVDTYDNLDRAGLKTLARWDLGDTREKLKGLPAGDAARELLFQLFNPKPEQRPSMDQVLESSYFAPQRRLVELQALLQKAQSSNNDSQANEIKQQMAQIIKGQEQLKKGQEAIKAKVEQLTIDIRQLSEQVAEMNKVLSSQLRAHSNMLKTVIHGADEVAPQYCVFVPRASTNWWNALNVLEKELKVYFVCPVTLEVPQDKDGEHMGYTIKLPRDWLVSVGPALVFGLNILPYALAVGRCAGFPMPCLPEGVADSLQARLEAVGEFQGVFSAALDVALEKVDETLSEAKDYVGQLAIESTSYKVSALSTELGVGQSADASRMMKRSVESVRAVAKLANDNQDFEASGLVKATCTRDGTTTFVSPSAKALYEEHGEACFQMSPAEISSEKERLLGTQSADTHVAPAGDNKASMTTTADEDDGMQPVSSTHMDRSVRWEIVKSGQLEVQTTPGRPFQSKKTRYFVLYENGYMEHFKSQEEMQKQGGIGSGKPQPGVLKLERVKSEGRKSGGRSSNTDIPLMTMVCQGNAPNKTLRAYSEADLEDWIQASQQCLGQSD